jgi:DNA polymerase
LPRSLAKDFAGGAAAAAQPQTLAAGSTPVAKPQPPAADEAAQTPEPVAANADTQIDSTSGEEEQEVGKKKPTTSRAAANANLFDAAEHDWATRPPLKRPDRVAALEKLCEQVAGCTRCEELAEARTQTVFGVGNPMARLAFLGEAPGADEDRQGEPFVGRAGQLLTKIIEACTLSREDVYIFNILKCRPPGNRNPQVQEAVNCREYLLKQLRIIQPEFICCLGTVAVQNLLDTNLSIGKLRGKVHDFGGAKVIATYHPAYLLRNPGAKRATWDDMKLLMREMGIELPNH